MELSAIPHKPGVYLMRDRAGGILYIGKARNLHKRVSSYFMNRAAHTPHIRAMVAAISHVDYIPAASEREALLIEQSLINQIKPQFNVMLRDDKSYPYVKLTMNEDFPRLFLTRTVRRDGAKYFGPYPSVGYVRHLLKYLWNHRFFLLRPCEYGFSEGHPLPRQQARQCLYYHTKECPAPCVGRISAKDYRKIEKEAETFFRGDFHKLKDVWQREMQQASKGMDYEKAAALRDNLAALEHMEERVTVREVKMDELEERVGRSRAITELQQALDLKKPPLRIECFDISHLQGMETVASLVVFEYGIPKKQDYRKFKIRSVAGIDDFASMAEVVGRRYRRLISEGKTLPDLILIDGGKGQLRAAVGALKKSFLKSPPPLRGRTEVGGAPHPNLPPRGGKGVMPPITALAKHEEELFLPDKAESIRLADDSPALHLVQHIRDEAHRFAVTFHRQRRAKHLLDSHPSVTSSDH